MSVLHRSPANLARYERASLGSRAADRVSAAMGSWRFLGIQTLVIVVWVVLNVVAVVEHWDAYPFILLNLIFSVQAAYASPLILLAQNQQSEHDRVKAENDFHVNEEALTLLKAVVADLGIDLSRYQ